MRGRSPFGNPVFWIVAAFVLPEIVKKCKPLAKVVGDTLSSAAEVFHKAAEEPPKEEAPAAAAEPEAEAHEEPAEEEPAEAPHAKKSKSKGAEAAE